MSHRVTGNRSMRQVEPPAIRTTDQIEELHSTAWKEWVATLTPDEKLALEALKLDAPKPPKKARRARRDMPDDEQDSSEGTSEHFAQSDGLFAVDVVDPFEALARKEEAHEVERPGTPAARFEIDETTRRDLVLLGYVLPAIIDAADPRLEASLIALALRMGARQGITIPGLRDRHQKGIKWLEASVRAWEVKLDVCRASLTLLRIVLSSIVSSRNPRLEADSISMAARFGLSGGTSMTQVGEFHGVCKAAISARVRRWVRRFGLALPRDCKENTDNYRLFNVAKFSNSAKL